jgi:hypothetical protein
MANVREPAGMRLTKARRVVRRAPQWRATVLAACALSCGGRTLASAAGAHGGSALDDAFDASTADASGRDTVATDAAWLVSGDGEHDATSLGDGPLGRDAAVHVGGNGEDAMTNGGAGTVCPPSLPNASNMCSQDGLVCEYGADPQVECNTLVACSGGVWVTAQAPETVGCDIENPPSCAPTYGDVPLGSCPVVMNCFYPTARCSCSACGLISGVCPASDGGAAEALNWICDVPSTNSTDCPVPRPRVGSTCSLHLPGAACDYGACHGGITLQCSEFVWRELMQPCPP